MKPLLDLTTLILLIACNIRADSREFLIDNLIPDDMRHLDPDMIRGVVFQLYKRENGELPERMDVSSMSRNNAEPLQYFDPKRPVHICIHGWRANGDKMATVRRELLKHGDYNVIVMNWSEVDTLLFPFARLMVTSLGQYLAFLLDVLVDKYHVNLKDVHIIGYSLGAHIAGEAGRLTSKGRVGRITGLDPAGPLFQESPDVLSHDAAEFVDIIHTCGNIVGIWEPIGHADFYPNGGTCVQPGCFDSPSPTCSHNRAIEFFAESINSKKEFSSRPFKGDLPGHFSANKNRAVMGYSIDKSTRGVYFLKTSSYPPFADLPPRNTGRYPNSSSREEFVNVGGDLFLTNTFWQSGGSSNRPSLRSRL